VAVGTGVCVAVAVGLEVAVAVGVAVGGGLRATIRKPGAVATVVNGSFALRMTHVSRAVFELNNQDDPVAAASGTVAVTAPRIVNVLTSSGLAGSNDCVAGV
jgi:hypothetical protein